MMRPIIDSDPRNPSVERVVPIPEELNRPAFEAAKAYYRWPESFTDWPAHVKWNGTVWDWVRVVQTVLKDRGDDLPRDLLDWSWRPPDPNDETGA